jgi:hypothetical protein
MPVFKATTVACLISLVLAGAWIAVAAVQPATGMGSR